MRGVTGPIGREPAEPAHDPARGRFRVEIQQRRKGHRLNFRQTHHARQAIRSPGGPRPCPREPTPRWPRTGPLARYRSRPPAWPAAPGAPGRSRPRPLGAPRRASRRPGWPAAARPGTGRPPGRPCGARPPAPAYRAASTRRGSGSDRSVSTMSSTDGEVGWLPERGDQSLYALILMAGDLPRSEQRQERLDGPGRVDGLEGEDQPLRPAAEIEPAGLDHREPLGCEFSGRQPQAILQERVDRPVEGGHRQFGRAQARELGSGPARPRAGREGSRRSTRSPSRATGSESRSFQCGTTRTAAARTRASGDCKSSLKQLGPGLVEILGQIERLPGPEGLETMVLVLGITAVELGDPIFQFGNHLDAPLLQHAPCLLPGPLLGCLQRIEQVLGPVHRPAWAGAPAVDPWP